MDILGYVRERIKNCDKIELSTHAKKRAALRGIEIDQIRNALEEGELLGVRDNYNPNVDIEYEEAYIALITSSSGECYGLPIYFQQRRALITTVLKLSKPNLEILEW
ncbi:MAG: DUF4258 domain-containing protein [Candidatus Nanohaloarchaea archaeon]|nr:DUF4258 domain-containing protein [Candidatus Nanohaloarchaea archaeon]